VTPSIDLNSDLGEGFGAWPLGNERPCLEWSLNPSQAFRHLSVQGGQASRRLRDVWLVAGVARLSRTSRLRDATVTATQDS
jgi:hypothetical protein